MYYSKAVSHPVLHTADCPHCQRINPENLMSIKSLKGIIDFGLRYCLTCNPWEKIMKKEEAAFAAHCASNGILFRRNKLGLRLTTPRSEWQIVYDGKRTHLYHRNVLHEDKRPTDLIPGFHDQNVSCASLVQYCEYIVDHDYYRMLNPMYPKVVKTPPIKGTKRYQKEQKQAERRVRREAISNMHRLIAALSAEPCAAVIL